MSKKDRMKKVKVPAAVKEARSRANKLRRLEARVAKNPNDFQAAYSLALIKNGEKGFAG